MELSKKDVSIIKGVAILFLVFLHLFNIKDYIDTFSPVLFINETPIVYYLSLVSGCCVQLYLFCSGYGLSSICIEKRLDIKSNLNRIIKLLINYWIILIIFVLIGHFIGNENYPGSIKEFILNFFLLSKSYNGAWWFLQTYVILVFLSKFIINIVNKFNSFIVFFISGIIYFITFVITIKFKISNGNFEIIYRMIVNLLTCQFTFILGGLFVKEKIISRIRCKFEDVKYKSLLIFICYFGILIINILIENYIINPITAIALVLMFSITKISKVTEKILLYLSKHSTNIWLTHMFFYMIFFKKIVYYPKYPLLIFIWLITLCLVASYVINLIYKFIIRIFNNTASGNYWFIISNK